MQKQILLCIILPAATVTFVPSRTGNKAMTTNGVGKDLFDLKMINSEIRKIK